MPNTQNQLVDATGEPLNEKINSNIDKRLLYAATTVLILFGGFLADKFSDILRVVNKVDTYMETNNKDIDQLNNKIADQKAENSRQDGEIKALQKGFYELSQKEDNRDGQFWKEYGPVLNKMK